MFQEQYNIDSLKWGKKTPVPPMTLSHHHHHQHLILDIKMEPDRMRNHQLQLHSFLNQQKWPRRNKPLWFTSVQIASTRQQWNKTLEHIECAMMWNQPINARGALSPAVRCVLWPFTWEIITLKPTWKLLLLKNRYFISVLNLYIYIIFSFLNWVSF